MANFGSSSGVGGGSGVAGIPLKTKTALLSGNQETVIVTPSSGKKIRVLGAEINQEPGAAGGGLKLATSGIQIAFTSEISGQAGYHPCNIEGAVNEGVTAVVENASINDRFFFLVNYIEV